MFCDYRNTSTSYQIWNTMKTPALFFVLFLSIFSVGLSKKVEGTINDTDADWLFLTRFCFMSLQGRLSYDISYPQDYGVQNLLFYFDTPGQWETAYRDDKTCTEKVAVLKNDNFFPLDSTRCTTEVRNGRNWYRCRDDMRFRSARERWWYLVIERCGAAQSNSVKGMYLDYYMHMTNGENLIHQEFSADQFYILPIDIVFFVLYVILLTGSIIVAVILKKRNILHTTYKMYMASLIIWTIALLFLVIAWATYGNTGWELESVEVFGRILQSSSTVVFILQLILMGKGYTIVRGRLTNKAVFKIVVFIVLYSIGTIFLYGWEANYFDPALVLYYYESPPGYCMIFLQLLGWLWLTKASVFTLKHYSRTTSKFYIPFYVIYSVWFWTGPLVTMLAMMVMAKWTREKTVHGVQQLVALLGHVFFFVLTLPCTVNSNFPYNTKGSQIGDVNNGMGDGASNMYSISHEVDYEGTGPNLDFFVTSSHQSNTSAGISERMYGPLDNNVLNACGNTPPPSYNEVTSSDPLPPIGTGTSSGDRNFSDVSQPQEGDFPNGRLPPISGEAPSEEIRLPPIRASGLPPLVPSAPPAMDDDDMMSLPPLRIRADMFQVQK